LLEEEVGLRVGETLDPLGGGVVVMELLGEECGLGVGETLELLGTGVGVGDELGFCMLVIAYRAAPIIMPLVLSILIETTRPLSSTPSEYPLLGSGR